MASSKKHTKTYTELEQKTARGHIMSPPLDVCNGLASPADAARRMYCEICEVIRCVAAPV